MKFIIKQNILMEHLNYAIRGVSNKNLIPILNCIKFELTSDGLYLLSTDNEIAIKTFIDKSKIEDIDTLGEMVISGRYIYDIVKKLPNELITIEEVMNSKIYITTKSSSFNLNSNNVNDFPEIELEEQQNPIYISKKVLKTTINEISFATSNQESRPVLTGINFNIVENQLHATATDSYRLAKKSIVIDNNVTDSINITIPNRNITELIKLFNDEDDSIGVHIFNNKVIFRFNSIVFMTRIINGQFPDTDKLIPDSFEFVYKCNYNELYNAIDRASIFTSEAEKNIINLEAKDNEMTISSNIPEIGNVKEVISVVNENKNNINISFSSKYMMDALKSLNSNEVLLLFNGEIKPIIMKNPNSDNLIQLIVPIRTY